MTYDEFIDEWSASESDTVSAHTSGSTGTPKHIRLSKPDMLVSARATNSFFGVVEGDVLAIPLAADYIAGKMMAVRAIDSGARLLTEQPSRRPLVMLPPETVVKIAAIVPQQIRGLAEARCRIENVIVGGGPVSPEDEAFALQSRPESDWWATYGMTETCSHVALRRFGEKYYKVVPGVTFSVTSDNRLIVSHGQATWSPVVTNDIVDLIDSHTFVFRGRADNAIISGGIKIHPEEVEQLIAPVMGTRRFYITARASAEWGSEVTLVVECPEDNELGARLLTEAAALAGSVRRPRSIIWLPEIPLTNSGKIIRQTF